MKDALARGLGIGEGEGNALSAHELRNEVSSVDLMSLLKRFLQQSRDGILPAGGLFALKQGESDDTSFLQ